MANLASGIRNEAWRDKTTYACRDQMARRVDAIGNDSGKYEWLGDTALNCKISEAV